MEGLKFPSFLVKSRAQLIVIDDFIAHNHRPLLELVQAHGEEEEEGGHPRPQGRTDGRGDLLKWHHDDEEASSLGNNNNPNNLFFSPPPLHDIKTGSLPHRDGTRFFFRRSRRRRQEEEEVKVEEEEGRPLTN